MAIVRELVTILGTEFQDAGLKKYEAGMERVKEIALGAASAMGLAFSVEKISEFIEGILDSGKEINKIRLQIANIARPIDDVNEAMERTYTIAQEIGASYVEVADTFRDFLQASRDTKISQEELLAVTENIFKATKVDRLSDEQQQRLMHVIQRVDVMGKASPRMIGMLQNTSISALELLEHYFKTNEDGLRELAKAGKITFEEFTKALGSTNDELNAKFANLPWTWARGWQYARNTMVSAAAEFLKVTRLSIIFGTAIKWITDQMIYMFRTLFNALGGAQNAFEVLGIAMALVLGPRMIGYLITMVGWMWRLAVANAAATWEWIAMAAAVLAVAAAIQDLAFWITGKKSLIGTFVGPFKDLAKNFENLDIFAGFRLPGDIMRGDWTKALEDFHKLLNSTPAIILTLLAPIGLVTTAFVAWGLSGPIGAAIKALGGVKDAIIETEAVAKGAGVAGAGKGVPELVPGSGGPGPRAGPRRLLGRGLGLAFKAWWMYELGKLAIETFTGPGDAAEDQQPQIDAAKRKREEWNKAHPGETPPLFGGLGRGLESGWNWFKDKTSYLTPGMGAAGEYLNPTSAGVGPPPGSLGPAGAGTTTNNDNKTITFNQTNSVTVQGQDDAGLADKIGKSIGDFAKELFSGAARDLGRSSPRTEAATQ